jgi:hypothetical protein
LFALVEIGRLILARQLSGEISSTLVKDVDTGHLEEGPTITGTISPI